MLPQEGRPPERRRLGLPRVGSEVNEHGVQG
jgi:hypothetical protein